MTSSWFVLLAGVTTSVEINQGGHYLRLSAPGSTTPDGQCMKSQLKPIILSIICGLLQFKITIQIIYSVENYYTDYILTPKVANIELISPGLYILCQGVSIYFLSATTNKTPSEMGCYL